MIRLPVNLANFEKKNTNGWSKSRMHNSIIRLNFIVFSGITTQARKMNFSPSIGKQYKAPSVARTGKISFSIDVGFN